MSSITRRTALAGLAGLGAAITFPSVAQAERTLAQAARGWRLPEGGTESTDVRWLTTYETTSYITYMHMNGFFGRDSRYFAYRAADTLGAGNGPNYLRIYDTVRATSTTVPGRPDPKAPGGVAEMVGGYLDVSETTGVLLNAESANQAGNIFQTRPRIWGIDVEELMTTGNATWELLYQVPVNTYKDQLITFADTAGAINNAGTALAFVEQWGPVTNPTVPGDVLSKVCRLDLVTGERTVLVEAEKNHNHIHFSPFDDDWIVFSREGDSTLHKERVWAHHPVHAPNGANVMPQFLQTGQVLRLSHERAAWHAPELIAVSWDNPEPVQVKRSLWRGFLDGSEPELLYTGPAQHCDISRDGRFAVIDCDHGRRTEILIVDLTGEREPTKVADSHWGTSHPRHNHPIFSPDGRYVMFNDADETNTDTGGLRIGVIDLRAWGYPV